MGGSFTRNLSQAILITPTSACQKRQDVIRQGAISRCVVEVGGDGYGGDEERKGMTGPFLLQSADESAAQPSQNPRAEVGVLATEDLGAAVLCRAHSHCSAGPYKHPRARSPGDSCVGDDLHGDLVPTHSRPERVGTSMRAGEHSLGVRRSTETLRVGI